MIQVKNLSMKYGSELLFSNLSFELQDNTINVLIGHNGTGKTTLLKIILGLIKPTSGNILLDGVAVDYQSNNFKGQLGFMLDSSWLIEKFSALEFLNFIQSAFKVEKRTAVEQSKKWLKHFNIHNEIKLIEDFSHGMKKIVGFIAAIITQPSLIILDEPFEGMDEENKRKAFTIIDDLLNSNNSTFLIVTHQMEIINKIDVTVLDLFQETTPPI